MQVLENIASGFSQRTIKDEQLLNPFFMAEALNDESRSGIESRTAKILTTRYKHLYAHFATVVFICMKLYLMT